MSETFIGHPCKKCGGAERYANSKRCVECHRATRRAMPRNPVHHFPVVAPSLVRNPTIGAAFPATRAQLMAGR